MLGKCEGVTEKSDEFISELEVESEKTSFTVKENGCQQVSTFSNNFSHFSHFRQSHYKCACEACL